MTITNKIKRIASVTGLAFGAFALSVFAAGSWTPPSSTPPTPNVDAPLNVGSSIQSKIGWLGLKDLAVTNSFQITSPGYGNGKFLAMDADGYVSATSSLVTKITAGKSVSISPTSGIGNVTVNLNTTCNFNGLAVMTDSGDGDDFGLICKNNAIVGFCFYGGGLGSVNYTRGLRVGQYNC